jgi:hypothetical protein
MTTLTTTSLSQRPRRHSDDPEISPVDVTPQNTDPYSLQSKLIPEDQLLRRRGIRRKVRKFYETQNAMIEGMLKSVDQHRLDADAELANDSLKVRPPTAGRGIEFRLIRRLKLP